MSLLNSSFDGRPSVFKTFWEGSFNIVLAVMKPIWFGGELTLYEHSGDGYTTHQTSKLKITPIRLLLFLLICTIFLIPCTTFALTVFAISAALSLPAIAGDIAADSALFWSDRYKDTCISWIINPLKYAVIGSFLNLRESVSIPIAAIAAIPITLAILPIAAAVSFCAVIASVATGIFSVAESLFKKLCWNSCESKTTKDTGNERADDSKRQYSTVITKDEDESTGLRNKSAYGETRVLGHTFHGSYGTASDGSEISEVNSDEPINSASGPSVNF